MSQRKTRELALQMLFQREMADQTADETEQLFWNDREAADDIRRKAVRLFRTAVDNCDDIDMAIERAAHNWRLSRLGSVDRNLLRLAVAEMLYHETPPAVVINEAIAVAKRFGSEKSSDFVNGVLDSVRAEEESQ